MDTTSLREAGTAALAEMEAALSAIENPQEGADVDALERNFSDAETRHASAVKNLERAEKVAESRKNLPVAPVAEEPAPEVVEERSTPAVSVGKEERTYEPHKGTSYIADLTNAVLRNDQRAWDRLNRHAQEMTVDLTASGQIKYLRDVVSTTTTGGADAFVPPLHLVNEGADYPRNNRVYLNWCGIESLPVGTDSITVPRQTTGVSVAAQAAQLDNFSETDLVATPVSASVCTYGGIQDVSVQALEQSALREGLDGKVLMDLNKAYEEAVDAAAFDGAGTSGTLTGINNVSSINAVTWTYSTPTVALLYPKVLDAVQQIWSGAKKSPDAIFMHPRRWAWILASFNSGGTPYVAPVAPQQNIGSFGANAEGQVGSFAGLPVYLDQNIQTTESSTQDVIYIVCRGDQRYWESPKRIEVFRAAGSQNGMVRFRLYAYQAFLSAHFPESIGTVTGSGLTTPSF